MNINFPQFLSCDSKYFTEITGALLATGHVNLGYHASTVSYHIHTFTSQCMIYLLHDDITRYVAMVPFLMRMTLGM